MRRLTKKVMVGWVPVGGDAPIAVQSMTTTQTANAEETLQQIFRLAAAGCEIIRVAVPTREDAAGLPEIVERSPLPVVADIHFDYRLALIAADAGVHKIRFNPGNIGTNEQQRRERVALIVEKCKEKKIPIRVGVNSGSIDREVYGTEPEAIAKCALDMVKYIEDCDYNQLIVSLKSFDVPTTIQSYRYFSERSNYPLHLGITESGLPFEGSIRSSIGFGVLLWEGIGDTIRYSLTGDPEIEVKAGWELLKSLNLRNRGVTIVSCPTCGRIQIDLFKLVDQVKSRLETMDLVEPISVAVMGCIVNGPGESQDADVGVAGGRGIGIIYRKGQMVKKVKEDEILDTLMEQVAAVDAERRSALQREPLAARV
jgi:(E)-4-hydroxy-3-methylbut-2-enyl-diphosphate synthase